MNFVVKAANCVVISFNKNYLFHKGSRNKKFFVSGTATKALSPPLKLSGHIFSFIFS